MESYSVYSRGTKVKQLSELVPRFGALGHPGAYRSYGAVARQVLQGERQELLFVHPASICLCARAVCQAEYLQSSNKVKCNMSAKSRAVSLRGPRGPTFRKSHVLMQIQDRTVRSKQHFVVVLQLLMVGDYHFFASGSTITGSDRFTSPGQAHPRHDAHCYASRASSPNDVSSSPGKF